MFAFSGKQNEQQRRSSPPSEEMPLAPNLLARIWEAPNKNGGTRFNWQITRVSEDGRRFATCRPEDVLSVPLFTAKLAEAFASSPAVDEGLRKSLAALAVGLYQLIESPKPAFTAENANGPVGNGSLFTN